MAVRTILSFALGLITGCALGVFIPERYKKGVVFIVLVTFVFIMFAKHFLLHS